MRKFFLCIGALLFAAVPVAAFASFSDVSPAHPNTDAIQYVQEQGIVSGYADGTFRPDQKINRAEFTKIMVGASLPEGDADCGLTWDTNTDRPFVDVNKRDWFAHDVCRAYMGGLITGYGDGTFHPEQSINFVEAAKIIARAFDLPVSSDAKVWYKGYVDALANRKSIPVTIQSFDTKITRGEMAEMIYRLKAGVTNKLSWTYDVLAVPASRRNPIFVYDPESVHVGDWVGGMTVREISDSAITFDGEVTIKGEYKDWRLDPRKNARGESFGVCMHDLDDVSVLKIPHMKGVAGAAFCFSSDSDISRFVPGSTGTVEVTITKYVESTTIDSATGNEATVESVINIWREEGSSQSSEGTVYRNPQRGFTFRLPAGSSRRGIEETFDLPFIHGTTLQEKFLTISTGANATASSCFAPAFPVSKSETIVVNGISYTKEKGSDNGMSQYYDSVRYTTGYPNYSGSICVSFTFTLHSVSQGPFDNPPPLFDVARESAVFDEIMASVKFE